MRGIVLKKVDEKIHRRLIKHQTIKKRLTGKLGNKHEPIEDFLELHQHALFTYLSEVEKQLASEIIK